MTYDFLLHLEPDATKEMPDDRYLQNVRDLTERSDQTYPLDAIGAGMEAFTSRRRRAIRVARHQLQLEMDFYGDAFNPGSLRSREFAYIMTNETAGLLGRWTTGAVSDAFVVAASALRAAFWLWLEDDDRSMTLARTVLEQTARLRTWRLKPARAQSREERGARTSTRDWLDDAGWRRLSILNQSLGEFSHASPAKSRWKGAADVLVQIQPTRDEAAPPPGLTGRGDALNRIAFAFGAEVLAWATQRHPFLADALSIVLPHGEAEAEGEIEVWLQRCWDHRGLSLGELFFTPPP